ncbi:MAG: hypothetical protein Q4P34_08420 [Tissierellia bacterium]|nr:hypothetical protein [Tissierellia bacterium]
MKKYIFGIILALIPYAFLSLYIDANHSSYAIFGYMGMLIIIGIISFLAGKKGQIKYTLTATMISALASYILSVKFLGKEWNYYFIPFEAKNLAILICIISIIAQSVAFKRFKEKFN